MLDSVRHPKRKYVMELMLSLEDQTSAAPSQMFGRNTPPLQPYSLNQSSNSCQSSRSWTSHVVLAPELIPTELTSAVVLDSVRRPERISLVELLLSVERQRSPSPTNSFLRYTSSGPHPMLTQSSNPRQPSRPCTSQVEFNPQLLPTQLITPKIRLGTAPIPTLTSDLHLRPSSFQSFSRGSRFSGIAREVGSTIDHASSATNKIPHCNKPANRSSSSALVPFQHLNTFISRSSSSALLHFEHFNTFGSSILGENECQETDPIIEEVMVSDPESENFNVDLILSDEDGDADYFYYELDYLPDSESSMSQDLEAEELPEWYKNQVKSRQQQTTNAIPLNTRPDLRLGSSTLDKINEDGSAFGQTTALEYGDRAPLSGGDMTSLRVVETPRLLSKFDVDLERALAMTSGSEFEAVKTLYEFTQASAMRRPFQPPTTLETVVKREVKLSELEVYSFLPKEELVKSGPPHRSLLLAPTISVNWEEDSNSSMNYQKVWKLLKSLEESWIMDMKQHEINLRESLWESVNPHTMHLRAASSLKRDGHWLHNERRPIGHCPGVIVGACFNYRVEMLVIGLHRALQNGIGVVPGDLSPFKRPFATSVILITGTPHRYWKDDIDMGETVVYCGEGGWSQKLNRYQNQKLERGNLALENSYKLGVPIRLIRGHRDIKFSRTGTIYSYDGLYKVTSMKYETGVNGNEVFLFTMVRYLGQGALPVPSKDALIYKDDATDAELQVVKKSRSRKVRTPAVKIKSTASGFELPTKSYKSVSRTEPSLLVPKEEPNDKALILVSPSTFSTQQLDQGSQRVSPEAGHGREHASSIFLSALRDEDLSNVGK